MLDAFNETEEWRCQTCRVRNKNANVKCISCEAYRSDLTEEELEAAKKAEEGGAKAAFEAFKAQSSTESTSFAFPTTTTGFTFGTDTSSTAPATTGFTFGTDTSASSTTSSFTFSTGTNTNSFAFNTSDKKDEESTTQNRKRKATSEAKSSKPIKPAAIVKGKGKGIVMTLGSGDMAQLGLGLSPLERKFPTIVPTIKDENIIQVAAGALHNLAVTASGKVYSWGCNDDGAIGRTIKSDVEEFTPMLVEGLDDIKIVQVACGASHSVAVDEKGDVYSWGAYRDASGLVGFDTKDKIKHAAYKMTGFKREKVIKVAAGESHSLALTESGKVYYWGDVFIGRRSSDRHKRSRLEPAIVPITTRIDRTRPTVAKTKADIKIVDIFAGGYSSYAISESGLLWVWGPNNYTQCGIERLDIEDQAILQPTVVNYFSDRQIKVKAAACASQFSIVLTEDSRVFAFGRVADGRLGMGEDYKYKDKDEQVIPLEIETLSPEYLSSEDSWEHVSDTFEQEKHPKVTTQCNDRVISISCGESHSLAVTARGRLIGWGNGELLQLGNGIERVEYEPYWVRSHAITTLPRYVIQASGGSQHSIILVKDAE